MWTHATWQKNEEVNELLHLIVAVEGRTESRGGMGSKQMSWYAIISGM